MHRGSGSEASKLPFFLVAGMFGNVLNLRHLAHLVGSDRPFYGLQARGLYGDHKPHETFEEMARDYIAELRTVQPHGPYLLGGFSGGGITAYEMARQLRGRRAKRSPLIVMLDTPLPKDDPRHLARQAGHPPAELRQAGPEATLVEWWAKQALAGAARANAKRSCGARRPKAAPHDFHSAGHRGGVLRGGRRLPAGALCLSTSPCSGRGCGPPTSWAPAAAINADRRRIYHDNGWAPFVRRVEVFEMPGDHDSMVLEPNVRVLAARLRDSLDTAETSQQPRSGNGHGEGATSAGPNGNNGATSADAPSPRRPSPAAPV